MSEKKWVVYLVRCSDNSLYCGISNDLIARLAEHNSGKGAKYTNSRRPVALVGTSAAMTKSEALKLEYSIKQLPADKKTIELNKKGDLMPETGSMPERIISLTPSLTEILFALKLSHRVSAVTDSCDYPAEVRDWPNVACWFDPDLGKLLALKPDLVLGLQTAHNQLKLELESRGIPALLVNPTTVDAAIADMIQIGNIMGAQEKSKNLAAGLQARLAVLDDKVAKIGNQHKLSVCRILDMEDGRFHVAGPLSFQYDIISRAGGQNVTCSTKEAYPKITLSQLRKWNPEVIFNCGFDLTTNPSIKDKPAWQSLKAVQTEKVFTFDCNLTCRTGPRIVDMVALLFKTLYGKGNAVEMGGE
jgi:iron complex transport system substrate-binding protein